LRFYSTGKTDRIRRLGGVEEEVKKQKPPKLPNRTEDKLLTVFIHSSKQTEAPTAGTVA